MTTLRGQLLSDLANLLDQAERINAGHPVRDVDRETYLRMAATAAIGARDDAHRRVALMTVAEVALAWLEAMDVGRECRVDAGDVEEAA